MSRWPSPACRHRARAERRPFRMPASARGLWCRISGHSSVVAQCESVAESTRSAPAPSPCSIASPWHGPRRRERRGRTVPDRREHPARTARRDARRPDASRPAACCTPAKMPWMRIRSSTGRSTRKSTRPRSGRASPHRGRQRTSARWPTGSAGATSRRRTRSPGHRCAPARCCTRRIAAAPTCRSGRAAAGRGR